MLFTSTKGLLYKHKTDPKSIDILILKCLGKTKNLEHKKEATLTQRNWISENQNYHYLQPDYLIGILLFNENCFVEC